MKISNLLDTAGTLISLTIILIASFYSHYFISSQYLFVAILSIVLFNIIIAILVPNQKIVSAILGLHGALLLVLFHYNLLSNAITLVFIAFVVLSLAGVKYISQRLNKEFQIVSNIATITQLLAFIFIPFYLTFGFKVINMVKQSPPLTNIKYRLINLGQEASITNTEAVKLYEEAKELSYQGKVDEASDKLNKALYKQPDNAYLHSQMSRLYLFRTDSIKALEHINQAINLSQDNKYYLQQRSWLNYSLHLTNAAYNDVYQLQKIDSRNAWAQMLMAYITHDREEYDTACKHADSASMFCDNYLLQEEIGQFIANNCGHNQYFNLIKPYEYDFLTPNISYYYKIYTTNQNGEPDIENGIPPKGNYTKQEIKQHIIRNQNFFADQEVDFIYLYEDEKNILIVIRRDDCNLSKKTLNYIFVEPDILENFELRVI